MNTTTAEQRLSTAVVLTAQAVGLLARAQALLEPTQAPIEPAETVISRIERRKQWMVDFEKAVLAERPTIAGRIVWSEAGYFFGIGREPQEAAIAYCYRHNELVKPYQMAAA